MSPRARLAIGGGIAALVLTGVLLLPRDSGKRAPASPARPDSAAVSAASMLLTERTFGDTAAPVVIFEFSDFQCPYCRQFWEKVLPALEREYLRTGKARLIYLNLPLPTLHANAVRAHEYAMCVARDNHFRRYHDLLYQHQSDWEHLTDPGAYFRGLADSLGLNSQAIASCVDGHAMLWLVMGEAQAAQKAGLSGTPSFVLEGTLYKGSPGIEQWRPILDSLYQAKKMAARGGKGR